MQCEFTMFSFHSRFMPVVNRVQECVGGSFTGSLGCHNEASASTWKCVPDADPCFVWSGVCGSSKSF